jgi:extradiol dioxygenase family protein
MPHLGVALQLEDWKVLAGRLSEQGINFELAPSVRFHGQPGEQWTMFFYDPSGNPIEIKGFPTLDALFQTA